MGGDEQAVIDEQVVIDVEDEVGEQQAPAQEQRPPAIKKEPIQIKDRHKKRVKFPPTPHPRGGGEDAVQTEDAPMDPPIPFDQDPSLAAGGSNDDPIQGLLATMMQHEQEGTDVTKGFDPPPKEPKPPKEPNAEKLKADVFRQQQQLEEMRHRQRQREIANLNKSTENITRAVEKQKILATAGADGEDAESFSSRLRLWRMYCDYKKRLGCPGTGEHVGFGSAPVKLAAQIEVQRQQAQQQRATGSLEMAMDFAVEWFERVWNRTVGQKAGSIKGLYEEDWKSLKEHDEAVRLSLIELEIEYADLFRSRPEMCILFALGGKIARRAAINRLREGGDDVPVGAAPRDALRPEYADL